MPPQVTAETVRSLWAHMQEVYGSTVIAKDTSATMQAAAALLDALNIQDTETFMKHFTTTLGKTIYIPFEIGVESEYYRLWGQLRVCVHEHQHIVQGNREGWVVFGGRYLSSSSYRAGYEAEAFGCDLEMEYWRNPTIDLYPWAGDRAAVLQFYGCNADDIEQARQALLLRASVILSGVVENESTRHAIDWLEKCVPELKGV